MGKGSTRRNEDIKKIWDNWDAIFGKKDQQEDAKQESTEEKSISEAPKENAK